MARIRTLKPEALQHRKVGRLTDRQFRLWLTMITQADDEGRLVADAGQLRIQAFGYFPEVTDHEVDAALEAIASTGLVLVYTADGTRYVCFPSWTAHQRIDHPRPSTLPPPPASGATSPREPSRTFDESSTSSREPSRPVLGDQGSRTKDQGELPRPAGAGPQAARNGSKAGGRDLQAEAKQVLALLVSKSGRRFETVDANLGPIRARLAEHALEDVENVVRFKAHQWPAGHDMHKYLRPETLFRASKFQSYLAEMSDDMKRLARTEVPNAD